MTKDTPKMPSSRQPGLTGFALTYPTGTHIEPHSHDVHQLIHAISGTMRVYTKKQLWVLPVGRALWIPAKTEHEIRCNGAVKMRTAYLSPAYTDFPEYLQVLSISPLLREVLVRLAEGAEQVLQGPLALVLLHEIKHADTEALLLPLPADKRIAILAASLRSNPESHKTITDWAKELGFSERNLIRRIREVTGMTFRELRRQTRVITAIEKLAEGQTVTNVALDVGFETPSAFISAFKTVTGLTPKQFGIRLS
ncbi:AraC family transcriptional regulator [Ruegeria atlantica]|uniref:AraC family transcriptional regulator n=1 Tax=Ruegeria atlantica TaxID=81569 RepID=UPI00147BAF06|nr:helix-turn-helix transcriptional regulator [Ruegeria atlantica]